MSSTVKVSQAIRDSLIAAGKVKGDVLTISLSALVVEATQTRLKPDAKREMLAKAIETAPKNEAGNPVLNPKTLHVAGLPKTYVTAASLWAGIGEASRLSFELGYHSEYHQDMDDEGRMVVRITLTPLSDEDKASMVAKLTERERKAATQAATPAVVVSDAGAAEAPSPEVAPSEPATEGSGESTATA